MEGAIEGQWLLILHILSVTVPLTGDLSNNQHDSKMLLLAPPALPNALPVFCAGRDRGSQAAALLPLHRTATSVLTRLGLSLRV